MDVFGLFKGWIGWLKGRKVKPGQATAREWLFSLIGGGPLG